MHFHHSSQVDIPSVGTKANDGTKRQRFDQWHAPAHSVLSTIACAARDRGCAPAVEGTRRLSYSELFAEVSRTAEQLRRAGVGPGTLTAVRVYDGVSRLCFLLAILGLRATYVPIAFDLPALRVRSILEEPRAARRDVRPRQRRPICGSPAASATRRLIIDKIVRKVRE